MLASLVEPREIPSSVPDDSSSESLITHDWVQELLKEIHAQWPQWNLRFTEPVYRPQSGDWLIEVRQKGNPIVLFRLTYSFGGLMPCGASDFTDQLVIFHPASSFKEGALQVGRLLRH